jgi:hypothetical protein
MRTRPSRPRARFPATPAAAAAARRPRPGRGARGRPPCAAPVAAAALALALFAGCPRPARVAPPREDPGAALSADLTALTIPPGPASAAALRRLAARADRGEVAAAWARAHYLLDLFDDARFRRDDASLALLCAAGDLPAARGAAATDAALGLLGAEINRVLRADRLHPDGQAARALVEFDRQGPARRDQLFRRIGEVKAVARGGPLAANARLRLYGFCRAAFTDAVRAPWSLRMRVLAHCLYPLYDSDPEPYFADDPARRPPPPRWQVLGDDLTRLAAAIAADGGRLAPAGRYAADELARFLADHRDRLPDLPDPDQIGAPRVAHATPYDWTPLLALGDGAALPPLAQTIEALARPAQGDGRGALALALAGQAPMTALAHAVEVAAGVGAVRLELLVAVDQRLVVPPGDYWSPRLEGDRATRLAVVPVMLAAAAPAPEVLANLNPNVLRWQPERARLGLHLEVAPDRWRLVAATGTVAVVPTGGAGDPATRLREALAEVRAAFPGESGLALTPTADASYGAVLAAAVAAATDADGQPLFPMLGFAAAAPRPDRELLRKRIDRRRGARVDIAPAALAGSAPTLRACYQDRLEARPELGGVVRVELREVPEVVAGPADPALRRCVLAVLRGPMAGDGIGSAEVRLTPR